MFNLTFQERDHILEPPCPHHHQNLLSPPKSIASPPCVTGSEVQELMRR